MIGEWLRKRKRRHLRESAFPVEWLRRLERNVPHYSSLSSEDQAVLRGDLRVFIAEKHWEGCGGLRLTDEMKVTVAAQACLLTLKIPHDFYPNVHSILLYPASYVARQRRVGAAGVVTEGKTVRLGEAWETGSVVLSWKSARHGGRVPDDGRNLVFHEFAHMLDMLDGTVDGTPRLPDDPAYRRWFEALDEAYWPLRESAEQSERTFLDGYGAESAGELFAVATESFFEQPGEMKQHHPRLYAALAEYYRQDPASRFPNPVEEPV
jgi:MtfA peptidase